ncbi:MAG TPA: TIGR01777 family oxidoreductase [Candidatus Dormibacteraeota bacterium]
MRVVLTGATGTIGTAVAAALQRRGDEVVALTRDPDRAHRGLSGVELHAWPRPASAPPPEAALAGADAVVHLLGEPVAQRWTESARREISDSRVLSTRSLVAAIAGLPEDRRPRTLVSQSATGFYGPHGDEWLDERSPAGADFLAGVVVAWEREALAAADASGLRVVVARTGVVLSPEGGALAKMLPPFRLGAGGPVAGGRQWVSWVHLDDVAGALLHCVDDAGAAGPVNVVAPTPVTNAELSRTLGAVLRRPAVTPVPALALRLLYGEMASMVTTGQRVSAGRLLGLGYAVRYPDLEPALRQLLGAP